MYLCMPLSLNIPWSKPLLPKEDPSLLQTFPWSPWETPFLKASLASKDWGKEGIRYLSLFHALCHQGPHPSQQWAQIVPSLPSSAEVCTEADLVALDMPCQTQFQALTFLTMSVHAWPVSAFLLDYLVHPPSPGRVYTFQLCCPANPSFTSASFWSVLPKEPVALYCKYSRHHTLSLSSQQDHSPAQRSQMACVCSHAAGH